MALTDGEVAHIARLARLDLTDAQRALYREQLSQILDHISKLKQLDTRDIPPTAGGGLASLDLRADQPAAGLARADLLANAPLAEDDQFRTPPVFE